MGDVWMNLAISAAVFLGLWLVVVVLRGQLRMGSSRKGRTRLGHDDDADDDSACSTGAKWSEREERLARRLMKMVGCTLLQGIRAIRREIGHSPDQADETLLGRAAYHYRRELPDKEYPPFRGQSRG